MTSTTIDKQTDKEIQSILDFTVNEVMKLGIKAVSMDDISKLSLIHI